MHWLKTNDPPNVFAPPVLFGSLLLSGFAPIMRGTSGTLAAAAGLGIWVYLAHPPQAHILALALALALLSLVVAEWGISSGLLRGDPGWFVLDEAAGVTLTLGLLNRTSLVDFCFAFVVFRFYDIAKPWPANSFEYLPRSAGILLDDLAAACLGAWTIWTLRLAVGDLILG
jgi:phosphatidylglycerophosphatase A